VYTGLQVLRVAVMIYAILVNTHTHTHIDRQTDFDRLYYLLSYPAELKIIIT